MVASPAGSLALVAVLLAGPASAAPEPLNATGVAIYQAPALGLTVVSGEMPLPRGSWEVVEIAPGGVVDQVQVTAKAPPGSEFQRNPSRGPRPGMPAEGQPGEDEEPVVHVLRGLLRDPGAREVRVSLQETVSGEAREITWALVGASPGGAALLTGWARDRARGWRRLDAGGGSPVLRAWIAAAEKLYSEAPGADESAEREWARLRAERDPERFTDVIGILGGRAALEETLQMQLLGSGAQPWDLLGWWRFDGCDGTDSARAGRTAKLIGKPHCVEGAEGKALELAGGSHLEVADLSAQTSEMTVAAWVRPVAEIAPEGYWIAGMAAAQERKGRAREWSLVLQGGARSAEGGVLALRWLEDARGGACVADGVPLLPGAWHHLAASVSRGKADLFVDGAAVRSCTLEHFPESASPPFVIGGRPGGSPEPGAFAGAVDEVRLYRRALVEWEIQRLHSLNSAPIPIAGIKGVEVKSHPFEALLAGAEGMRLPLADVVPLDRFLVWFAKPSAVFPFLEEGADFIFRVGSAASGDWVDDDLAGRYLRRLGLGAKLGRRFLESGEVTELAITAPDLFFLDGTDITVVMRLKHPDSIAARLRDLGVADLDGEGVHEKKLAGARSAWWALRGDLLLAGTNRAEVQASLDLAARGGEGSLGRSAELRYMLSRQEPRPETRAVAYFSDAFVRRLTGPAVKIGQLRRMRERTRMVQATSGALLRRLDTGREERDLSRLEALGYTPPGLAAAGWRLREDFAAISPAWGTAAEMETLASQPVEGATDEEAEFYRVYVEQYARYWRQYFDPIALRLDDAPGGDLSLSLFVLPLADSQLYGGMRRTIASGSVPLRAPMFEPQPVLELSLSLAQGGPWVGTEILGSLLRSMRGPGRSLAEQIGPGVHLAVLDADPVLALGNGDLLGAFGSGPAGSGIDRLGIPLLFSVLTRPCKIAVELKDPAAVVRLFRGAALNTPRDWRSREVRAGFRQVGDRDAWVLTLDFARMAKLRLGLEVQQGYLVVSNTPWSHPAVVTGVSDQGYAGAALNLLPGLVGLGLPALFATQQEQNQSAALKGIAALYPLLAAGSPTPAHAARWHAALWGSTPLHPGAGGWLWEDGRLGSTVYGDGAHWKVLPWQREVGDFGVFEGVKKLAARMRFEDEGLRALCTWSPVPARR